jgi:hypothetical protein
MRSFKDRIAGSAGRPIDAACAARAPGTVTIWALTAGVCGGIAANVGDSLTAAAVIGGGLALIGSPISWVRARRRGLWPNMALVLTVEALELLRLTLWGSSVVGTIRTCRSARSAASTFAAACSRSASRCTRSASRSSSMQASAGSAAAGSLWRSYGASPAPG